MHAHPALREQYAAFGIEPGSDQGRHHLVDAAAQGGGILRHGDGVQINDAEHALGFILHAHPVADGAQIIAQVQIAGGLNARENPLHAFFRFTCATRPFTVNRPSNRAPAR